MIKNRDGLAKDWRHVLLLDALEEALAAADPRRAVLGVVERRGDVVEVAGVELRGRVHVVGFGKASRAMAEALVETLGDLVARGVAIDPAVEGRVGPIRVVRGDHPTPGPNTAKASQELLEYLASVGREDSLVVLVSDGGSSFFEVPEGGVSFDDISRLTQELMRRGADIVELNAVRKRLSKVKGGKLLRFIKAQRVVSLIVSDVVGDRLDVIASGPTAPDESTREDAIHVLKRYGLWDELPPGVRRTVESGVDTVRQGDPLLEKVVNVVVASNVQSLRRAAQFLSAKGFNAVILTAMLEGEAREAGRVLASVAKSASAHALPAPKPAAVLAGGETMVTVRGNGVGGRNQELCLSFAIAVQGSRDIVATCMGTDGVDGNSPAAGAAVDGSTVEEAEKAGLDPYAHLANNDSYTFFKALGRAIYTGYTGTNVNDIFIALVADL